MASDGETSCITDPNFAVICSFLEKFGTQCGLRCPDFLELQEMLENTEELAPQLVDLHLKLLRKIKKSVSTDRWERVLIKVCHTFSSQDAWELERFGYRKARVPSKIRILKNLMEMQFDFHLKFKSEINRSTAGELRAEPIGKDKHGHSYWYLMDDHCQIRVYREDPDEETWELVAKDREGLVQLIKQLASGEVDIQDLDSNLNEDSNSLEIEKPITDTGQLSSETPSVAEGDELPTEAEVLPTEAEELPTETEELPAEVDKVTKEDYDKEKTNTVGAEEKKESISSKEDSKESDEKPPSEDSDILLAEPKPEISNDTIPEFRKIKLTVKNFNTPEASVGMDLSIPHIVNPITINKVVDLTSKRKKSINDLATDLRIKTQVKSQIDVQEHEIDLSIKKPTPDPKLSSLGEPPIKPIKIVNTLKLSTKYPLETEDSEDEFDDSDEIDLPSHMKHPRLDRPTLLGNSKKFNKSFSDEDEFEDEIDEPVMYIRGEGSGKDCNSENETMYCNEGEYGAAIEEPIMFFYGHGSGKDCETGNTEKDEETNQKPPQIEAATSNQLETIHSQESSTKNITTDSDPSKAEDKIDSANCKIGKIVFDSVRQKTDKTPPKKHSRWDVKIETNEAYEDKTNIIEDGEDENRYSDSYKNEMVAMCNKDDTDSCPTKGNVKDLISKWEKVATPTSKQSTTDPTDNLSITPEETIRTLPKKPSFFFGPNSLNNNPFFQAGTKTGNPDFDLQDGIASNEIISNNSSDIQVPIIKADNLVDNKSSEVISEETACDKSGNDNGKEINTIDNTSNTLIDSTKLSEEASKKEEISIVESKKISEESSLDGGKKLCGTEIVESKLLEKEKLQTIISEEAKDVDTKLNSSILDDIPVSKDDITLTKNKSNALSIENATNMPEIISKSIVKKGNNSTDQISEIDDISCTKINSKPTSKIADNTKIIDKNTLGKVTKSDDVLLEVKNESTIRNLSIDNTSNLEKDFTDSDASISQDKNSDEEKATSSTDALLSDIEKLCADETQDGLKELFESKKPIDSPMDTESLIRDQIFTSDVKCIEEQITKKENTEQIGSENISNDLENVNKIGSGEKVVLVENLKHDSTQKPILKEDNACSTNLDDNIKFETDFCKATTKKNVAEQISSKENIIIEEKLGEKNSDRNEDLKEKGSNANDSSGKTSVTITTESPIVQAITTKNEILNTDLIENKRLSDKRTELEVNDKRTEKEDSKETEDVSLLRQKQDLEVKTVENKIIMVGTKKDEDAERKEEIGIVDENVIKEETSSGKQILFDSQETTTNKEGLIKNTNELLDDFKEGKESMKKPSEKIPDINDLIGPNISDEKLLLVQPIQDKIELNDIIGKEQFSDEKLEEYKSDNNIHKKSMLVQIDKKLENDTNKDVSEPKILNTSLELLNLSKVEVSQNENIVNKSSEFPKENIVDTKENLLDNVTTDKVVDQNEEPDNKRGENKAKNEKLPRTNCSEIEKNKSISKEIVEIEIEDKRTTKTNEDNKTVAGMENEAVHSNPSEEMVINEDKLTIEAESSTNKLKNEDLNTSKDEQLLGEENVSKEVNFKKDTNIVEKNPEKTDLNVNSLISIENKGIEVLESVKKTDENADINLQMTTKSLESKEIDDNVEKTINDEAIEIKESKESKVMREEKLINAENLDTGKDSASIKINDKIITNEDLDKVEQMPKKEGITSKTDDKIENLSNKEETKISNETSKVIEDEEIEKKVSVKDANTNILVETGVESSSEIVKTIEDKLVETVDKDSLNVTIESCVTKDSKKCEDTRIKNQKSTMEDDTKVVIESLLEKDISKPIDDMEKQIPINEAIESCKKIESVKNVIDKSMVKELSKNDKDTNKIVEPSMELQRAESETIEGVDKQKTIGEDNAKIIIETRSEIDSKNSETIKDKEIVNKKSMKEDTKNISTTEMERNKSDKIPEMMANILEISKTESTEIEKDEHSKNVVVKSSKKIVNSKTIEDKAILINEEMNKNVGSCMKIENKMVETIANIDVAEQKVVMERDANINEPKMKIENKSIGEKTKIDHEKSAVIKKTTEIVKPNEDTNIQSPAKNVPSETVENTKLRESVETNADVDGSETEEKINIAPVSIVTKIDSSKSEQESINTEVKSALNEEKVVLPTIQAKNTKTDLNKAVKIAENESKAIGKTDLSKKAKKGTEKIVKTPLNSKQNIDNASLDKSMKEEKGRLSAEGTKEETIAKLLDINTKTGKKSVEDQKLMDKNELASKSKDEAAVKLKLTESDSKKEEVTLQAKDKNIKKDKSLEQTTTTEEINETIEKKTNDESNLKIEKNTKDKKDLAVENKSKVDKKIDNKIINTEKNLNETDKLLIAGKIPSTNIEKLNIDIGSSKNIINKEKSIPKNIMEKPSEEDKRLKNKHEDKSIVKKGKNTELDNESNAKNSECEDKVLTVDKDATAKKPNIENEITSKVEEKCHKVEVKKGKLSTKKQTEEIITEEKSNEEGMKKNQDILITKDNKKVIGKQSETEELSKKEKIIPKRIKVIKDAKLFENTSNKISETNIVNDEAIIGKNKLVADKNIVAEEKELPMKTAAVIINKISIRKDLLSKPLMKDEKPSELEEPKINIPKEIKMTRTRARNIKIEAAQTKKEAKELKDNNKKLEVTRSSKRLSGNKTIQNITQNKNVKTKINVPKEIENKTVEKDTKITIKKNLITKVTKLPEVDPLDSKTKDNSSDSDNGSIGFGGDAPDYEVSDEDEPKEIVPNFLEVKQITKPLLTVIDISKLQKRPDDEPQPTIKPKKIQLLNVGSPICIENEESSDVVDITETDPLACTEEDLQLSGPSKPVVKPLTLATFKIDSDENEETSLLEPIRRNLRRRQIDIPVYKPINRKRTREPTVEVAEVAVAKKQKTRGRRSIDVNLRRNIEEQKRKEAVSSDEEEEEKVKVMPKSVKVSPKKLKEEVIVEKAVEISKKGKGKGRVQAVKETGVVDESPVPSSDVPSETSRTDTNATPTSVTKAKPNRKKKSRVLGLDIDTSAILPERNESDRSVRQSRRIAQIKIKEEACRKYDDGDREVKSKKKKLKKEEDKVFKASPVNSSLKKKKKGKAVSEEEESDDEDEEEETTESGKKKHKKLKKPQDLRRLFNMNNPWRSSSESSSHEEEEEEVEEEISEDDKEVLRSDHEFSPESDLEGNNEIQPMRRARTVKKESDTEEPTDVHACQKCSKSDHPEWILLCDGCDCGWHCSCLRPALLVIPEGDWYCPPCQHISLITALRAQLVEYDKRADRHEMEARRKERLAYVGISLDNVLSNKEQNQGSQKEGEKRDDSSSDSRDSGSSSGSSSGDESEPIYQLRERRQAHSYRFNDYDELINSAIQDEIEAGKGAGNQGRGKDIATIVNAEKEDVETQGQLETQPPAEPEIPPVVPANTDIIPMSKPPRDKSGESGENDDDSEEELRVVPKHMGRKKHRKLNSLDINSEDDVDSDEDFKGESASEKEDFEEDLSSYDSDDSNFRGRRRGGPVRRSTRARTTRYDREFINDETDEDNAPRKKKSRSMWDESASEESDKSWGRRGKYTKKKQYPTTKFHKKSKKKRKRLEDSDGEIKPKVKRPRIKYGGLDESDDEVLARRTRGKKTTYVDTLGSDSEEENIRMKSKARIIESEDEYIANEEDEDEIVQEPVVMDKEENDAESTQDEIPPVVPKKIIKLPALAKIPKSPRARGRGRGIGVAQRQTGFNLSIAPIILPPVAEPAHVDEEEDLREEIPLEDLAKIQHLDIPVIAENPADMDDDEVGMMMEEEEFANKQLELMAIQLAKEKKKKELEALKVETPTVSQIVQEVVKPEPKKRGRRKKFVEGVSPLKQQLQQAKIVPPVIISKALIKPPLDTITSLEEPVQEPQDKPTVPSDSSPIPTVVQDLSVTPPKRRGRGKGKKTLAAEQAAAVATVTVPSETSTTNTIQTIPKTDNPTTTTATSDPQTSVPSISPDPGFHSGKLGIATPPQPFTQSQPTPSVITRMLQSQPIPAQTFATAANAMNQKYFGGMNAEQPRPVGSQFPGLPPRGRVPSPYRQNIPSVSHYPGVRTPLTPGSPHRLRSPGPPNIPQMFHSPHHPLDPSPSGGGHITSSSRDRQSPADISMPTKTPPPAQYSRAVMTAQGANRFPGASESVPGPSASPVRPHHLPFSSGSHLQPASPPTAAGGNFSPYHPPPPPNYHYGAYPPPPSLAAADDALPPTVYQSSPYSEQFNPVDSVGATQTSEGSNSKPFDEEGSGEFGGLVSYFSSQREDDLDA